MVGQTNDMLLFSNVEKGSRVCLEVIIKTKYLHKVYNKIVN